MARILIVGGGCRGRMLAAELAGEGHAVRISSRGAAHRAEIEAAGAECWAGTPDAVGSLRYALENVTLLLWALGTATGPPEAVDSLHGSRLEMMLRHIIDTTVRGVIYEAAGSVDPALLADGARLVAERAGHSEIPHAVVRADPAAREEWVARARGAIDELLARPAPAERGTPRPPGEPRLRAG